MEQLARNAREAALGLAALSTESKNQALATVKRLLTERKADILAANAEDRTSAKDEISSALYRRLDLQGAKFDSLLAGLDDVQSLPDPVGQVTLATQLDSGLDLYRVTCPLGVVCIIFEARPDAAVQISALSLKSANAVILKGGREAERSNNILVEIFRQALAEHGLPVDAVQLVNTREEIKSLLAMDQYIDLIIPRGSNDLVRYIQDNTRIPVMGHADGICAVYLHSDADLDKAVDVVVDAKTQYPAVCNATETLLVHRDALPVFARVATALAEKGVHMFCDKDSLNMVPDTVREKNASLADDSHYRTEFLDLRIAVKTVDSLNAAIQHINSHGSHHTDCIVTESKADAETFLGRVDSANVFHNASTRFADGFRYGFGAEVGVSTNKTHARGPVGLEGMVIYKYRLYGKGHKVADFGTAPGAKKYLHTPINPQLPQ